MWNFYLLIFFLWELEDEIQQNDHTVEERAFPPSYGRALHNIRFAYVHNLFRPSQ